MLVLLLASAFSAALLAHAQTALTDEQARKLAANTVAKVTNTPADQLNTKRREDLEDVLFSFQRKIAGRIHKAAYFYDVVNGGYQITANEATYSTPTQRWLVAISADDGTTFGLEGFSDGEAAFDELISKAGVEIHDTTQAQNYTRFYLSAVYGNADNVVYDELRLRHKVQEHFVGYADSQEPPAKKEQRFRTWWTAFKAKGSGPLAPTAKAEGKNRYRVLLNILSMTVGRPPELWQWSVQVQSDGTTRLLMKQLAFPPSSKRGKSTTTTAGRKTSPQTLPQPMPNGLQTAGGPPLRFWQRWGEMRSYITGGWTRSNPNTAV